MGWLYTLSQTLGLTWPNVTQTNPLENMLAGSHAQCAARYFMGGSSEWRPGYRMEDICSNLIPLEIALKIAAKIRAQEPFAAYIIIPLWPEGTPLHVSGTAPMQAHDVQAKVAVAIL